MSTLEIRPISYEDQPRYQHLHAVVEGKTVGHLTYYQDGEKYVMENLKVDPGLQRTGIGKGLVENFAKIIGRGIEVEGDIAHLETVKELDKQGILQQAKINTTLELTDRKLISKLPLVKLLKSGKIKTNKVSIEYDPTLKGEANDLYHQFKISFTAVT